MTFLVCTENLFIQEPFFKIYLHKFLESYKYRPLYTICIHLSYIHKHKFHPKKLQAVSTGLKSTPNCSEVSKTPVRTLFDPAIKKEDSFKIQDLKNNFQALKENNSSWIDEQKMPLE